MDRRFFQRDVKVVAQELLGIRLCRRTVKGLVSGFIVETEAYLALGDSASHSFRGQTRKNSAMFGPPGRAYVYAIHAKYCLNVVTEPKGIASAVLIRAVEPDCGVELMQQRRNRNVHRDLTRGPARLCQAFAVGPALNHFLLTTGRRLWLEKGVSPGPIARSPRIGVTSAHDDRLRFFIDGNQFVSGPAKWHTKPPRASILSR